MTRRWNVLFVTALVPILLPAPAVGSALAASATPTNLKSAQAGERMEVEALRTEFSTTWANPDGSKTTEFSAAPVRVRSGSEWAPVDTTLERKDSEWRAKSSATAVAISGGPSSSAPLIEATTQGRSISLDWPKALPAPQVNGSNAEYHLAEGTSVRVSATASGFRTHIVLATRPGEAPVWRLPLRLSGMDIAERSDGSFAVTDQSGKRVFDLAAPVMWDATVDGGGVPTNVIAVDAKLVSDGRERLLELTPDPKFLSATATKFPVVIDPDISLPAVRDTFVKDGSAANTSFSADPYLRTGLISGVKHRAFELFNMTGMTDKVVNSAQLQLHTVSGGSCTPTNLYIWPATSAWTSSATWNNQPPLDSTSPYATSKSFAHGNEGLGCSNAWESINVTSLVQAWSDGKIPNYGFGLRANEADGKNYKVFCSGNEDPAASPCNTSAKSPKLLVTYSDPIPPGSAVKVVQGVPDSAGNCIYEQTLSLAPGKKAIYGKQISQDPVRCVMEIAELYEQAAVDAIEAYEAGQGNNPDAIVEEELAAPTVGGESATASRSDSPQAEGPVGTLNHVWYNSQGHLRTLWEDPADITVAEVTNRVDWWWNDYNCISPNWGGRRYYWYSPSGWSKLETNWRNLYSCGRQESSSFARFRNGSFCFSVDTYADFNRNWIYGYWDGWLVGKFRTWVSGGCSGLLNREYHFRRSYY